MGTYGDLGIQLDISRINWASFGFCRQAGYRVKDCDVVESRAIMCSMKRRHDDNMTLYLIEIAN